MFWVYFQLLFYSLQERTHPLAGSRVGGVPWWEAVEDKQGDSGPPHWLCGSEKVTQPLDSYSIIRGRWTSPPQVPQPICFRKRSPEMFPVLPRIQASTWPWEWRALCPLGGGCSWRQSQDGRLCPSQPPAPHLASLRWVSYPPCFCGDSRSGTPGA